MKLTRRLVLFIDLLGTSQAAAGWDKQATKRMIELLTKVAAMKSQYSVSEGYDKDGHFKTTITPEITTFSDLIVASYPLNTTADRHLNDLYFSMYIYEAQKLVADLALDALEIGLLLRGSLTLGKLYHSSDVVFGEGLVDAHNLERSLAIYPRIVVSEKIWSCLPVAQQRDLLTDRDGVRHLDYFQAMVQKVIPEEFYEEDARSHADKYLDSLERNLKLYEGPTRTKELAKWSWFAQELSRAIFNRIGSYYRLYDWASRQVPTWREELRNPLAGWIRR